MTNPNDTSGLAFPLATVDGQFVTGLTKREEFAKAAMQGLLAESSHPQSSGAWNQVQPIVTKAVEFADALLAELKK